MSEIKLLQEQIIKAEREITTCTLERKRLEEISKLLSKPKLLDYFKSELERAGIQLGRAVTGTQKERALQEVTGYGFVLAEANTILLMLDQLDTKYEEATLSIFQAKEAIAELQDQGEE